MNKPLGKQEITGEYPPASWLAMLPWPGGKLGHPTHRVRDIQALEFIDLGAKQRDAAAMQLATSLRMHGIDSELDAMLSLLESLLAAGEIPHEEYFRRVENLFPHQMAVIDAGLKQKISALSG